jgi:hypothetical protein
VLCLQINRDDTSDDLDATLLLRQQIENSNLPSELKRSALITGPAWNEVLLDVNRTVKVCVVVLGVGGWGKGWVGGWGVGVRGGE